MTHKQVVESVLNAAAPLSKSQYYGDVYRINADPDIQYPAVVIQDQPGEMSNGILQLHYQIFWIEPLSDDYTNELSIKSRGITNLTKIVSDTPALTDQNFKVYPFTANFSTIAAGVYLDVFTYTEIEEDCDD